MSIDTSTKFNKVISDYDSGSAFIIAAKKKSPRGRFDYQLNNDLIEVIISVRAQIFCSSPLRVSNLKASFVGDFESFSIKSMRSHDCVTQPTSQPPPHSKTLQHLSASPYSRSISTMLAAPRLTASLRSKLNFN
jgi:hypothetical protein